MRNVEPRSLLPERPTPESWFLFVAVGLIGIYLAGPTFTAAVGSTDPSLAARLLGVFGAGYGFSSAWFDAPFDGIAIVAGSALTVFALTDAYLIADTLDERERTTEASR